jgi:hypothetical protein
MIDISKHRFIVETIALSVDRPTSELYSYLDPEYTRFVAGPWTARLDMTIRFDDQKALADFARIPEFTRLLSAEMDRLGICPYCGCQLPNDDKPNCNQCGAPRIDRT